MCYFFACFVLEDAGFGKAKNAKPDEVLEEFPQHEQASEPRNTHFM